MPGIAAVPDKNAENRRRINKTTGGKHNTSEPLTDRKHWGKIDITFTFIIMILIVFGVIMMYSAGYAWAIDENLEGDYYFKRQAGFALAGLAGMFVVSCIDYHKYNHPLFVFGAFVFTSVLMVLCVYGPFAREHNYARRWIKLPVIPEFQASELMKLAIILLFAYIISRNYSRMHKFSYGVIPFGAILAIVLGLLHLQPHYSAAIIICAIGAAMMLVGGTKFKHLAIVGLIGAAGLAFLMRDTMAGGADYIRERFISYFEPFSEEYPAETWQIRNSLIAIGSGGWFGLGLGNSRQKFLYLPESKNDFVFAIVCEELGFMGALTIIILFLLFILRGFYIAVNAPDKFGMMLAVGLTFQIGLQAMLNIAVVSNAVPCTGISLPFFSYGGTALVLQLLQMGIILNISRQSLKKK
ncbi:MAG: cell division protein FtsW [Oscillospiraceae bacterium]|nr:cell division protein FtsW [Oscillospiraceae bacterium]